MGIEINAAELALLLEAERGRYRQIKAKVAGGKVTEADEERCMHLQVLEHARFLEPLPNDGAYAIWRLTDEACEALRRLREPE